MGGAGLGRGSMDVEADFLTGTSSRDSLEESRVQFTFPPSVDLGTSYGSYLHSRKSSTRKTRRKKTVNVLQPLHRDLELLSASLNQLCSRLKSNGQTTGAIENALVGLQQLRSTVLATGPAGSRGDIVLYFLLQVVQALIAVTPNLDGSSLHLVKDKEEARALRRLYQTTEAELIATRRHCQKLKDRLDTVVEEADLKQSELSCELLATKKALAEARLELQREKTKAQTAYLTSSQSQRELGKYKKIHLMQQQEKKEEEIGRLRKRLADAIKSEEATKKQWINERMMLSQLKQAKSTPVPFTSALAQQKVQQTPRIPPGPPLHTKKAETGVRFKQQQLQNLPRRGLVAPIDSKWDELVKFAKFSNKEAATETRQILRKQGLLL